MKLFILYFFFLESIFAQDLKFEGRDRIIIRSVIGQFKKECGHVSLIDQGKLEEIQRVYTENKDTMDVSQNECYGTYLSQIVGGLTIYRELCDELTPKNKYGNDRSLARIFSNIRKYESGIKPFHENLNDCLIRNDAGVKIIVKAPDYESTLRELSRKIRLLNSELPFKENNVDLR